MKPISLSNETCECPVHDCENPARPYELPATNNGYAEACAAHIRQVIADTVDSLGIEHPAAACRRCGGWTGFGGMSQYRDSRERRSGRTGCICT